MRNVDKKSLKYRVRFTGLAEQIGQAKNYYLFCRLNKHELV